MYNGYRYSKPRYSRPRPRYSRLGPFGHKDENINIYPNATIEEVRKNVKQVDIGIPYRAGQRASTYQKGDFKYLIDEYGEVTALYIPSYHKPLKIMFEWNSKKKKWMPLTYREGER